MYFFKDKWYNIIGQYKKDGIQFYCNIASPYVIDANAVKYIDYDLDSVSYTHLDVYKRQSSG